MKSLGSALLVAYAATVLAIALFCGLGVLVSGVLGLFGVAVAWQFVTFVLLSFFVVSTAGVAVGIAASRRGVL